MKFALPKSGCRILRGLSILLVVAGVRCMALESERAVPPGRELLDKLDRAESASTLEARRRDIPLAMNALLEAPKKTLLGAMTEAILHGNPYAAVQRMLIEHCVERYPEEAIVSLDNRKTWRARLVEASWQVWSVIARTEPERAMAAAQVYFDPKHDYYREQLKLGGVHRPVAFIVEAVGKSWFKRDGVAALQKLGTLPHAQDIDGYLLEGMCGAVATVDDALAVLDWFVGPGRKIHRIDKGYDLWWERPLRQAALQDPTKTKAWIERTFPPGTKRESNSEADWDGVHLKRNFFYTLSKSNPIDAADWYAAQFGDEDPDGRDAMAREH